MVQPDFDYGYVPDSSKISHTFWINNIGTDSLKIFNVKLSCGCTKATFANAVVAVNDSVPLEIIFDNNNRLKKQSRVTTVLNNDPTASKFELWFRTYNYVSGEPTGPVSVIKNKRLRLTPQDFGKDVIVGIKNVSQEPLTARLVSYPAELVSVVMPTEPIAPGAKGEITVKVRSDIKNKNQLKSFTFEMSDAAKSRYTVPIRMSESVAELGKTVKQP